MWGAGWVISSNLGCEMMNKLVQTLFLFMHNISHPEIDIQRTEQQKVKAQK
jgi:hypothetical protein